MKVEVVLIDQEFSLSTTEKEKSEVTDLRHELVELQQKNMGLTKKTRWKTSNTGKKHDYIKDRLWAQIDTQARIAWLFKINPLTEFVREI